MQRIALAVQRKLCRPRWTGADTGRIMRSSRWTLSKDRGWFRNPASTTSQRGVTALLALFSAILLLTALPIHAAPNKVDTAFKKVMSLQGQWEGKDQDGNAVRTSFQSEAAGTALLETLAPSGMEEMLSLYSVDGDGIQLAHYCPTNNQPRMRAVPASPDPEELDFQFTGAGNLPDVTVGHQHRLVIRFEDADHITETWTWRQHGHDVPMVFHLARKH